jgi:hypothetical protein
MSRVLKGFRSYSGAQITARTSRGRTAQATLGSIFHLPPTTAEKCMTTELALPPEQTTFGLAATAIGVQAHHIERLAARNKIRFTRAGRIRLVLVSDFPAIRRRVSRRATSRPPRRRTLIAQGPAVEPITPKPSNGFAKRSLRRGWRKSSSG